MADNSIRLRQLAALQYYDPAIVLRELRHLEGDARITDLPANIRQLRTQRQKSWREGRIGALFAYGMGLCVLDCHVSIALAEAEDYDFVVQWRRDDEDCFCPVQGKEWPPSHLNDLASLDDVLARLAKSTAPSDTIALVQLNRRINLDLSKIEVPKMGFRELWFIGATSPDQNRWLLVGDVQNVPRRFEFAYPT